MTRSSTPGWSALVVSVLLSAVGTRPVLAQDVRLADRLPHGTAMAVQAIIDSAAIDTLPAEPLIKKALEGQSKGADSIHIIAAVRGLLANLVSARGALGPAATESDLVAGAAAIRAGASAASLSALRTLRAQRPLGVPLSVYADLLTSGVAAERAWFEVRELAERRAPDSEFLALRDRPATRQGPGQRALPPATPTNGPEHPSP